MFLQNVSKKICSSFVKDPTSSTLNFALLTVYLPLWTWRLNNIYFDDVNGSRRFKRSKFFFFYEFKDSINNIYIDDVNGFRLCKH